VYDFCVVTRKRRRRRRRRRRQWRNKAVWLAFSASAAHLV